MALKADKDLLKDKEKTRVQSQSVPDAGIYGASANANECEGKDDNFNSFEMNASVTGYTTPEHHPIMTLKNSKKSSNLHLLKDILGTLSTEDREYVYRELSATAKESSTSCSPLCDGKNEKWTKSTNALFELNGAAVKGCGSVPSNKSSVGKVAPSNKENARTPPRAARNRISAKKEDELHYTHVSQLIAETEALAASIGAMSQSDFSGTTMNKSKHLKPVMRVWSPTVSMC